MRQQVILVGRGLGSPTAERELNALADQCASRWDLPVSAAMLDHGEVSVHDALDTAVFAGVDSVLLIPVQVPRDRYLETWAAKAAAHWRERAQHSRDAGRIAAVPDVRLGPSVGASAMLLDMLDSVVDGPSQEITSAPASFRSPQWSHLGEHRYHVFVCRGPRCSSHGSPEVAKALGHCLQSGPVGYDDVLVTHTGCMVPCNLGPIVVVQPDDVWYTSVSEASVPRIVDEHFGTGRVVDDLHTPRTPAIPSTLEDT